MTQNTITIAETFYKAFAEKNIESLAKHLHDDVELISPLSTLKGKQAYLEAAKNFSAFFKTLTIRTTFGKEDQALVVYDVDCPAPIGKTAAASLLTFQEGLITRVELFHDTSPFHQFKDKLSA